MPFVTPVIPHAARTTGEGPHWDDRTQTLLYVDIDTGDIHRWNPRTSKDEKLHLDGAVCFVIPSQNGQLIVGLNLRIVSVDWASGNITEIATVPESQGRLNDAKCDASGRLWAGTMNMDNPQTSNLYSLEGPGTLKKQVSGVTISNGLAWSGDNNTMFYIDTPTRQVWAYDFDLARGTISNKRVAVDFAKVPEFDNLPVAGKPDGMTIDTEDKLWVACFGMGAVAQFDPQTGKLLRKIDFPGVSMTTSACWGGTKRDELYVTSIKSSPTDPAEQKKEENSGSVFRVIGLGTQGRPANVYKGQ